EAEEEYARRTRDRDALGALHRTAGILSRSLARLPDTGPSAELVQALAVAFRRLVARSGEADQVVGALASLRDLGALHGPVTLAEGERERERHHFALAVGSGARRLVLTYPRVDAESGRPRVPSFFLLDLLTRVTGRRHDFTSLERFPGFRRVRLQPAPESARV